MVKLTKEQEDALTTDIDERPIVSVKNSCMPTMSWEEETLILHAIPNVELMNSTTAIT